MLMFYSKNIILYICNQNVLSSLDGDDYKRKIKIDVA
jgi:hypothetical protein